MGDRLRATGFDWLWQRDYCTASLIPCVTMGLSGNRSVGRIKGNQATFDNSQRNNLRSCVWVWFGSVVGDVHADFSRRGEKSLSFYGGGHSVRSDEPA